MEAVDGGTRIYARDMLGSVVWGVHAFVPVATLFGVVHGPAIAADLGLSDATATLGSSLLFLAWSAGLAILPSDASDWPDRTSRSA